MIEKPMSRSAFDNPQPGDVVRRNQNTKTVVARDGDTLTLTMWSGREFETTLAEWKRWCSQGASVLRLAKGTNDEA